MDSKISLKEIKDIITNDLRNKLDENDEMTNKVIDFLKKWYDEGDEPDEPDDDDYFYFEDDDGTLYDCWDINRFGMPHTEEVEGILYRVCRDVEYILIDNDGWDEVVSINLRYRGNILVLWEMPTYQFVVEHLK